MVFPERGRGKGKPLRRGEEPFQCFLVGLWWADDDSHQPTVRANGYDAVTILREIRSSMTMVQTSLAVNDQKIQSAVQMPIVTYALAKAPTVATR